MKQSFKFLAFTLAVSLCLTACSLLPSKEPEPYVVVEPTNPQAAENTQNSAANTTEQVRKPISWEHNLLFGKLIYTVDDVKVIDNLADVGEGEFGEHSEICILDPAYKELASNNQKEYGAKYETVYQYPEYVGPDGQFMDGVYMIALDITVKNQDAANEYVNKDGKPEARYGNPYLFKTDSFLYLMDPKIDGMRKSPGFFSLAGKRPEHPLAYELKPGETISFRIGFMLYTPYDSQEIDFSDLVVSPDWEVDFHKPGAVYFSLGLEDLS